jgi:hypothetical protein
MARDEASVFLDRSNANDSLASAPCAKAEDLRAVREELLSRNR